MNLKKSIFSYIVLAAFAIFCFFVILAALEAAGVKELLNWPLAGMTAAVCGYLLLTAGVFFALRTIAMEISAHCKDRARMEKAAFFVLPTVILIGTVAYLAFYMISHVPLTLSDDSFYRQAEVSAGNSVPFAVHGASWLYPCLLHVMLLLFGNTPFAGVVLQIALFFMCLLFLYIGMQAYTGTLPAAVSMAALAFLPVSRQYLFSLTPELFLLALYLFGFCMSGVLFKSFRDKSPAYWVQYLCAVLLGVYISFLIYLDLYGISLCFFCVVLCSLDREKVKRAVYIDLSVLLGMMIGFVLFLLSVSRIGQMMPLQYLTEIFKLYAQHAEPGANLTGNALLPPDVTLTGSLVLLSFAFFVIPAFFLWKRNQNSVFILNLFTAYALAVFSIACMNMQMAVVCCFCMLAGAGFYGIVREPEEAELKKSRVSGRKKTKRASKTSVDEESGREKAKKETKASVNGNAGEEENVKENTAVGKEIQNELPKEISAENIQTEAGEQKKPVPGEPLHNPLPVPKKKSRPQADFGFQVKEADMKFDIDVADDDDFDV